MFTVAYRLFISECTSPIHNFPMGSRAFEYCTYLCTHRLDYYLLLTFVIKRKRTHCRRDGGLFLRTVDNRKRKQRTIVRKYI